jgi:hypothetical protein
LMVIGELFARLSANERLKAIAARYAARRIFSYEMVRRIRTG